MNFGKILKSLLLENGLSQTALAKKIGFSQRSISGWINEQAEPTESAIKKTAEFFQISTDFLLGRTDEFGSIITPIHSPTIPELSAKEKEILRLYNGLNPSGKELIEQTLKTLSAGSAIEGKKKA